MPKLPRTSSKKIIATLNKMGFVQVRQKGSHIVFRRGMDGCVVPLHKSVAVGTLAGIMKQANISTEEFMKNF